MPALGGTSAPRMDNAGLTHLIGFWRFSTADDPTRLDGQLRRIHGRSSSALSSAPSARGVLIISRIYCETRHMQPRCPKCRSTHVALALEISTRKFFIRGACGHRWNERARTLRRPDADQSQGPVNDGAAPLPSIAFA